ncbi:MAG: DNA replication protein psf1 [Sarcosagium campestre]|nr:MAG: DNA replication protein psf1 [Sarcosagium campestre]
MYGDLANKLALDAKRIQSLSHLPPYQTELVRAAVSEICDLQNEIEDVLRPYDGSFNASGDQATACSLLVSHLCMRRGKRCLLAYHRLRTEKIEEMCWEGKDALERIQQPRDSANGSRSGRGDAMDLGADGDNSSSLRPEEEEYIRQFDDLLVSYKDKFSDIDLSGPLEPPHNAFIDVRVLRDAGEIQTEYGAMMLSRNSQFYVRQADVEHLIAQGYLEKSSK